MSPVLDLRKRHFTREQRGLTLIGTWLLTGGRWRPCLVIMRTGDERSDHLVPCVVTVDTAWIWSEEIGDARRAARQAMRFCEALRLDTGDHRNWIMIHTVIADNLGDLLTIPPYQAEDSDIAVVADMTVTDAFGKRREVEISDHV